MRPRPAGRAGGAEDRADLEPGHEPALCRCHPPAAFAHRRLPEDRRPAAEARPHFRQIRGNRPQPFQHDRSRLVPDAPRIRRPGHAVGRELDHDVELHLQCRQHHHHRHARRRHQRRATAGPPAATELRPPAPTPLATAINLAHPGSVALPISLLSAPAFQLTLQAIASDQSSTVVQDPVIFTSNNREVTFKATTEEPIQEGSTTFGTATAATTSSIAYIEVGTQLTVLPSVLPGSGPKRQVVLLSLSINVSTIVGQQVINGNPYPVTSTRTYSYTVPIPSGQTLAIAGLEQRTRQTTDSKVPLLGDIPLVGYAFKSRTDQVQHTTLLAFITPEVMPDDGGRRIRRSRSCPGFGHRVFLASGRRNPDAGRPEPGRPARRHRRAAALRAPREPRRGAQPPRPHRGRTGADRRPPGRTAPDRPTGRPPARSAAVDRPTATGWTAPGLG